MSLPLSKPFRSDPEEYIQRRREAMFLDLSGQSTMSKDAVCWPCALGTQCTWIVQSLTCYERIAIEIRCTTIFYMRGFADSFGELVLGFLRAEKIRYTPLKISGE